MTKKSDLQYILTIKYDNQIKSIVLENKIYSIGRHSSNTITINNPKVSRYHCTILPVKHRNRNYQEVYWIIDGDLKGNRSSNGLFINGYKSLSHELKLGDQIAIGGEEVTANYQIKNLSPIEEIDISTLNIDEDSFPYEIIEENPTETLIGDEEDEGEELFSNKQQEINPLIEKILLTIHQQNYDLSCGIFEINLEGQFTYSNKSFRQLFPQLRSEFNQNPLSKNLIAELQNHPEKIYTRQIKYKDHQFIQYAHYNEDKTKIKSYLLKFEQRDKIETALRNSEEKYRAVVRQVSEGIVLIDPTSKQIIEANSAYCGLVGYDSQEILNLKLYDLVSVDVEVIDSIIRKIHLERLDLVQESVHRRQDNSLINVEVSMSVIYYGAKEVICFVVRDNTERKVAEEMLRYQACHDSLTKLANRNLFDQQLYKTIANAQRYNHQFAIIFLDLDRFKNINDTLGHDIGDKFLQEVARRLGSCVRDADLIARWGGDEFTILLSEIKDSNDAAIVAKRIIASLKKSFQIREYQLYGSLSMGIAIYPQDGDSAETLLKHADIALYRMKEQGRGSYQYYNSSMNQKRTELLRMEGLLYDALRKNEFELFYQPQINLKTKKITGMEALIRWQNSQLGRVSPADFIPIAEETGLINSIGEWVLNTACQQNKKWQQDGYSPLTIAVNLSARQFQQKNLIQIVKKTLTKNNLEPIYLTLELTETSIIQNPDLAKKTIEQLKDLKVSVSLDDFGTGYSSLGYLKKFSFDNIKIDQCFVRDLKNKPEDLAIIDAVVRLGKGFDLEVVAEGIENLEQLKLLEELQCEEMQGYFFSKPLPADEATEFIRKAEIDGLSFLNYK
jgi:diguanylate cyclase (GGDEF)-like protein/PAS domain S-box-containing protein